MAISTLPPPMVMEGAGTRRWDRHVGLAVSLPLCTLLLLIMVWIRLPDRVDPPLAMTVTFEPTVADPATDQLPEVADQTEPIPVPPTDFQEVAATRVGSDELGAEMVDPRVGELVADGETVEQDTPAPSTLQEWTPNTRQQAELEAIQAKVADEARRLEQRKGLLKESIVRQQVTSAAKDFILNSDGGTQGAIRLLNVDGFPQEMVAPVMSRYGITYERRHTQPSGGRSFLNAATTEKGTYSSADKEGYYDVMVLSGKAVALMASREVEALQRQGYQPANSRVIKIVFGIVKRDDGELDLDVIDLKVERIR